MKKYILVLVSSIVCFSQTSCAAIQFPEAKLTVRVVDQSGVAVTNAKAKAYFYEASSFTRDYFSGTNGIFVIEGRCDRSIGGRVEKDGYYNGGFGYGWGPDGRDKIHNRWEPWNPAVTAVMKEIRNPVPMRYFVGRDRPKIPEFDKPVGFDLEIGDWVSPYGKGVHSDIVFIASKIPDVIAGIKVYIELSSKYDGLQEYLFDPNDHSSFKWPYEAPESGYSNTWSRYAKYFEYELDYATLYPNDAYFKNMPIHRGEKYETDLKEDKEVNYIFRVRSVVDENGNLLRACYGKIEGEIKVSPDGIIHFRYWFNPDWTPNLEDDPTRNIELD